MDTTGNGNWDSAALGEELLRGFSARLIRTKVARICRSLRLTRDDGEDLEQQIRLELVTRASKFDPARGTWEAFVATVTESRARTHFRRLRKLPKPMPFSDLATDPAQKPDFPEDARLRHRGADASRKEGSMRLDVAFVEEQLDLDARIMTDMLRVFSVREVSSQTDIPLSTLYDRMKKLRRPFRELNPGDASPPHSLPEKDHGNLP